MSGRESTTLATIAVKLIRYGGDRGLDRDELGRIVGRTPEQLAELGHRVPTRAIQALYGHVMRTLADPWVPFRLAEQTHIEDLYVMGFATMTAPTGAVAIRRAVRYACLVTEAHGWQLIDEGDSYIIRLTHPHSTGLGARAMVEASLANFVHLSMRSQDGSHDPMRVSFRHSEPPDSRPHREFFRCPVMFGAAHDEYEVSWAASTAAPRESNPTMAAYFAEQAEQMLRERGAEDTLLDSLRREIADQLPSGQPSLTDVARKLAMSERTLRRRLADENTSFRQLVAEVRHDRARYLLDEGRVSLSEIAYLLGFSNVSAFSRAFKKWAGTAPGEFREART